MLEKAAQLKCYGASFGGNSHPTKFLCLILKLLQIQPPQELIDTFLETQEFKYIRVLGAFYKRLTARPADVYQALEPLYTEYCKLRYRDVNEWKIYMTDQFIHQMLHDDRVCGISLPRLPSRNSLVDEGYLENHYVSPILHVVGSRSLEEYLYKKVLDGSPSARLLWEEREASQKQKGLRENPLLRQDTANGAEPSGHDLSLDKNRYNSHKRRPSDQHVSHAPEAKRVSKAKKTSGSRNYGGLFKTSEIKPSTKQGEEQVASSKAANENTVEYWNNERAKLGLTPLRK